jgi:hypothetical protein
MTVLSETVNRLKGRDTKLLDLRLNKLWLPGFRRKAVKAVLGRRAAVPVGKAVFFVRGGIANVGNNRHTGFSVKEARNPKIISRKEVK